MLRSLFDVDASRRSRVTAAVVAAAAVWVLTGCTAPRTSLSALGASESPAPTVTVTVTTTATPAVTTTATTSPQDLIDFGSIGDITIDMTAEEIGTALDATALAEDAGPSCETATFDGRGPGDDARLARALGVLANSRGALGRVDTLELGVITDVDYSTAIRLRTAAGIGIGSSLDDVRAAYSDGLEESPGYYDPENIQAVVKGSDSTAIVFHVAGGVVDSIVTGRLPQAQFVEHCA